MTYTPPLDEGPGDWFDPTFDTEEYTRFPAVLSGFKSNARSGMLELNFVVSPTDKHAAFTTTDLIGEMVDVVVLRRVYPEFDINQFDEIEVVEGVEVVETVAEDG